MTGEHGEAPAPESAAERWTEEMTSVWLYAAVARAERDPTKARLFRDLAGAAARQAGLIAAGMPDEPPAFVPPFRARVVAGLVRALGPRALLPALAAMKVRGLSIYSGRHLEGGHPMPTSVGEVGGRHRGGRGGTLRAAVFGANDGLLSNTSLIMGVAGADADGRTILLAGVAGLLAGAFSMAAGEYVSMRSQREMFEYQIAQEREELALYPEEEAEELALIYEARGMDGDEARAMTRRMMEEPERALETLAREELGLNPDDLGSPWGAAAYSFGTFAVGGAVPLLPFLFGWGGSRVVAAALLAGAALFGIGCALSIFTGRRALHGGARLLLSGAAAAAATYGIGALFGMAVS
jgi:VIT1/CCC1 family predicted Fe2+/Mn2+ transporter